MHCRKSFVGGAARFVSASAARRRERETRAAAAAAGVRESGECV
jgi:hypothetical protein